MDSARTRLEEEDAAEKGETGYFLDSKEASAQHHHHHHDEQSPTSPGPSSPTTTRPFSLQRLRRNNNNNTLLLPLLIAFLAGALTVLFLTNLSHALASFSSAHTGTYETRWAEEATVLPANTITIAPIKFQSAVDFAADGTEFLVPPPAEGDGKKYVGEDDFDEIDRNWEALLWGRYFSLSEDEARALFGEDEYMEYVDHLRSGWTGGFDMFHQLHCLNQIRQAFHRDVYPETPIHGKVHLEHCIDHLRQGVMCWGSAAIIPVKYFPGYGAGYVKSDAVHTCRNFEPLREFTSQRFNGSLYVERPSGWIDHADNAF